MPSNATILLTRPRGQSERFADRCRTELPGVSVAISPILNIRFRAGPVDLDEAAGVILTSENSVAALTASHGAAGLPAWCVGARTAKAAAALGLAARSAGGAVDDLVAAILAKRPTGRLVHLRGAESRGDVAGRLRSAGLEVLEVVVYEAVPTGLSGEANSLLAGDMPVLLPLFSPRSAALLGAAANSAKAPLTILAISRAAADAWSGPPPRYVHIAARPDADAVLDEIVAALRRDPP